VLCVVDYVARSVGYFCVSQGSAATLFRRGGPVYNPEIHRDILHQITEIDSVLTSYSKYEARTFFETQCILLRAFSLFMSSSLPLNVFESYFPNTQYFN